MTKKAKRTKKTKRKTKEIKLEKNTSLYDFLTNKYKSDRYTVYQYKKTVMVYDKKTKKRQNLRHEIYEQQQHELSKKTSKKTKYKPRRGISLRFSHLFKCTCDVIRRSKKYKQKRLPKDLEHFYYIVDTKKKPNFAKAIRNHNRDYPDHLLHDIDYVFTKGENLESKRR
jgi:hypothetical protein